MLTEMWSLRGRFRILHLSWFAFFLTFLAWFNFAPFASVIAKELNLSPEQKATLLICNIALTIPARIIVGMILDRYGPRITFSCLLLFALIPCLATANAHSFNELVLSRLLMGIVGSGFVIGIRMVAEWFPPKQIGIAEGIYGGWGNFGAFGAEFALPVIGIATAFLSAGQSNWRLAIALSGVLCALYSIVYFNNVKDTPPGKNYHRPKRSGAIEVTSAKSFYAMLVMNFGLIFALGLLAWRLAQPKVHFLNTNQMYIIWAGLGALYLFQSYKAWQVNREVVSGRKTYSPKERYEFRQVALLEFTYVTNFGSELAAVSMLPGFFETTFGLDHHVASMVAATYPLINIFSRPSGGLISDRFGSRKWTMVAISFGIGVSYLMAHFIKAGWFLPLAVAVTMIAAYFAQAGCGATYGIVPLIKKEITGQISGNVGAYGNFGGVIYLTVFSLTDASTLFATMGVAAMICASLCAFFLKEPKGSFADHHIDDSEEEVLAEEQEERRLLH
jgi:MFS transporter, NNP family, nitrate/nitrite transporter